MTTKKGQARITLRLEPCLHERLDRTADGLGITLNALLNLLIRRSLGPRALAQGGPRSSRTAPRPLPREPEEEREKRIQVSLAIPRRLKEAVDNIFAWNGRTGALTDLIRMSLQAYEAEVRLYQEYHGTDRYTTLFNAWCAAGRGSNPRAFDEELRRSLRGLPNSVDDLPRKGVSSSSADDEAGHGYVSRGWDDWDEDEEV